MGEILRMNWQAFDLVSGIKVTLAAAIIFGLEAVTGESWLATGLVVLFAWLTNVPGSLKERVSGQAAFAPLPVAGRAIEQYLGQMVAAKLLD